MRLLAILPLLLLLMTPAIAEDNVADDIIHDEVRLKLAGDQDVRGTALEVTVEEGVVTLRGQVDKEKNKKKAEKLTKKIKGVKKVINELTVAPK